MTKHRIALLVIGLYLCACQKEQTAQPNAATTATTAAPQRRAAAAPQQVNVHILFTGLAMFRHPDNSPAPTSVDIPLVRNHPGGVPDHETVIVYPGKMLKQPAGNRIVDGKNMTDQFDLLYIPDGDELTVDGLSSPVDAAEKPNAGCPASAAEVHNMWFIPHLSVVSGSNGPFKKDVMPLAARVNITGGGIDAYVTDRMLHAFKVKSGDKTTATQPIAQLVDWHFTLPASELTINHKNGSWTFLPDAAGNVIIAIANTRVGELMKPPGAVQHMNPDDDFAVYYAAFQNPPARKPLPWDVPDATCYKDTMKLPAWMPSWIVAPRTLKNTMGTLSVGGMDCGASSVP
jgi:hypothetical protein